ncbi:cilia- and flagella-associated protein 61-like isoform X2 [Zophobas morio]|uniref:cilia- and flagella-associated protein 61-like isoform X2 n=1 Tax=Zophobas morio TaxID=2755281 RepID=UPI0030836370
MESHTQLKKKLSSQTQLKPKVHSLLNFVLSPDHVRRIGPQNTAEVEKLKLKNTEYLFGVMPVARLLLRSHLSVGIYNEHSELAGVLCLCCYPNIPALPPWDWEHWLAAKYEIIDMLPLTTLWIHYAVWDRRYTTLFLKPLLQWVYQTYEPLENVLMVCPPGIKRLDFIEEYATRQLPVGHLFVLKSQSLYITQKNDFVAHYVIRRAVEEDNDDLVAIIPEVVEETYGHYYISEILSNEESERQIIVAEHKGCAVGVLCLNEVVNYDLLNEEFELVPYNGLKKHNVADEVAKSAAGSATMLPTLEDSTEHLSAITLTEEVKEEEEKVEEDNISDDDFSLVNLSSSLILNFLYEEEDISEHMSPTGSATSIESHFSAVVLNEEYEDHLYNDRGADNIEEDRRLRRKESRQDNMLVPTFYGEPDAFAMEICTAIPEHENALYLLFEAAFECFPDRSYIVTSSPTESTVCYLTRHFARVVPRHNSVFNHELYVLHKNAVLGRLWARVAQVEDKEIISSLVRTLVKPSIIDDMFREAVDVPHGPLKGFTFMCEKQVIGCAIVSEESDHEYLQLYYNLDDWMNTGETKFGAVGHVEQFLVSPIFQRHIKFFLREVHRLSNFDDLMYRLKSFDFMYTHRSMPISNAINNMLPILPNAIPEYSKQITEEYHLPAALNKYHQPFGLYLSTNRITSMVRVEINYRLVVVGAGSTTISFLESLIFGTNPNYMVVFPNITVVSPHGIAYHKQPSPIREMVFVGDGHLDRRYMDSICLRTYVHVVTGVMTMIDRKEKFISLNDDTHLPYDYLFLMCGEQFQKPPIKKKEIVKKRVDFPQNVFIINTEADAGNAFNALKNLTANQKQGNMVVFGHYLEACCCLAALLEFGVPGNNLVYIDPSPDHIVKMDRHDHLTTYFNNSAVETAVLDEILYQGVTIYQDYNFVEWHLDSTRNFITSAKFESKYKFVEIELSALFIYHSKGVSARTFQAMARSGLVFNGRLVIDKNCQTNDQFIYGAGPLTMYSKKYHAEHLMHKYYNAQEIGYNLGTEIRKKLIPKEYWDPPARPPRFRKPVVQYCHFPGKLHYLHVSKPGPPVPLEVATIKSNYSIFRVES